MFASPLETEQYLHWLSILTGGLVIPNNAAILVALSWFECAASVDSQNEADSGDETSAKRTGFSSVDERLRFYRKARLNKCKMAWMIFFARRKFQSKRTRKLVLNYIVSPSVMTSRQTDLRTGFGQLKLLAALSLARNTSGTYTIIYSSLVEFERVQLA